MKYKTEVYTSYHSYTSYDKLSLKEIEAIQDSCYDDIPNVVETTLGSVTIYDDAGGFIPVFDYYYNPKKTWDYSPRSDWYTHVSTGLKVKQEIYKSPNYDSPNGNGRGVRKITLTVKIPQLDGRGKNPKSHNNKPKIIDGVTKDIRLTPEQWSQVEILGQGQGYSQGIRNLLQK
ncbi:MAG: hypothetical protein ACKPE3_00070 [Sphaerospermopsis kisseleviana]